MKLLTYNEAADLLRISESHLRKIKNKKHVPYVLIGKKVLFIDELLMQWVVNNCMHNN